MNFFSKLGVVGLIVASSTGFAAEPAMGWYAGLMVGPSLAPDTDFRFTHGPSSILFNVEKLPVFIQTPPLSGGKITYGVLVNGAIQVGYRCNKFRYEGELIVDSNSISKVQYNRNALALVTSPFNGYVTVPVEARQLTLTNKKPRNDFYVRGNTTLFGGFLNAYYEFYDQDYSYTSIVPYVGLGIGYASIENMVSLYYNSYLANPVDGRFYSRDILLGKINRSTPAPMGQGILGLSYFFSDTMSLSTDFRYMSTRTIKSLDTKYQTYTFNLLFNYTFDQPVF